MGTRAGAATSGPRDGLVGNTSSLLALAPRQMADELTLAKRELTAKGGRVGFGALGGVLALVFLGFLTTSLLVAAIMGLAVVMPAWLAALVVAAVFFALVIVGVLVAITQVRRAMPFVPVEAWRGLRHDVGVLRSGASFDPADLDKPTPSEPSPEHHGPEPQPTATESPREEQGQEEVVSTDELRERLSRRREHLLQARESLGHHVDIPGRVRGYVDQRLGAARSGKGLAWVIFGASAGVFVLLLKRLIKE